MPFTFPAGLRTLPASMDASISDSALEGKTVLHVLPALEAGGAELGTLEIAAALREAGARAVVASSGGRLAASLGADHVRLPVDSKNPLTMWRNSARLKALIAREGVDLVHAHSRAPAWSARSAARRAGVAFVTTVHGAYGAGGAVKRAYNRIMVRGDRVIAVSDFVAKRAIELYGCPPARIRLVYQGIDTAVFDPSAVPPREREALREAWGIPQGASVLLLPGRLTRLKGHGVLIEALRRLTDFNPVAVFVGSDRGRDAYRRELEALARDLPVRFAGHMDDMAAAYAASDVAVSASIRPESFGRVLAEAGAMGLPAVSSELGAAPEILLPGETGWLVPPGDPAALAAGIRQALGTAGPALAARARAHVLDRFTRARMCEGTLAVYRELV